MSVIIALLISFIAVRGFRFEFGAKELVLRNTESFIWLLLFLFFICVFVRSFQTKNRRLKLYAALCAAVIALFHAVGGSLERMTGIAWILQSRSMLLNFLNICFSFFCLYYSFTFISFSLLERHASENSLAPVKDVKMKQVLIVWVILLICYIPWYFYFYPGILTEDSGAQIKDAITPNSLSDHNPAFVTLLIRAVMLPVIRFTGSVQTGIGVCSFLQMMIMTFIFALAFVRICRYVRPNFLRILIFFWFAFFPVNNIYSITMWKDILFSGCLLGLLIYLDKYTEDESAFVISRNHCILLFLTMLLLPLLRHNGIAVTAGLAIYLPFRFKTFRRKAAIIGCSALVAFGAWKIILLPALHAWKSPSYELLNIPIQQMARVLANHHGEISPWVVEDVQSYFSKPEFWNDYWEKTADPIKGAFNNQRFDEDPAKFFSLWRRLGQEYPIEYLEAFLHNNYGYWYPETSWWINGLGVRINVELEGVHQAPIVRFRVTDAVYRWHTLREYNKNPILPLFYKPGAVWWLWVFCGCYALYRNRRKFILFLPGLLIWLTLLGSAVYCEFRYAYGLFTCLPLLLAAVLSTDRRSDGVRTDDLDLPG